LCYRVNGKLVQESSKTTSRAKAATMLRERLGLKANGELASPDSKKVSYEDFRESFFRQCKIAGLKSVRYRKDDGMPYLSNLTRLDDYFKGRKAIEITADDVRRFIENGQAEGQSNASINRALAALRRMYRLAVKDKKIRLADVPTIELCKEPPARHGFLERPHFDKLLGALPEYLRGPVTLAFHTGMRLGEIAGLRWNQVDLKNLEIRLNAGETKNDAGRVIAINDEVLEMLKPLPKNTERVFMNGKEPLGQFRKSWRKACVKAGLGKYELMPDGETEVYSGLQFHDLRRSGVRNLVRAGVPERVAMQISGHKNRAVFERYNIVSEADVKDAREKQNQYNATQKAESKSNETVVKSMEKGLDSVVTLKIKAF
jgi:integrase